MWLLHFLPDGFLAFVVNFVLIVGLISTILTFFVLNRLLRLFPVLANYHLALQVASVVILTAGVYFKGGYSAEMIWREKVAELEVKVKEAEAKSAQINTVVQTKVVTQTKVVKEKADTIVKYVDRPVIQEYDKKCPIPKEVIDIHNEATEMNLLIDKQMKEAGKK